HFGLIPNSNKRNPVVLPPGRAKLSTKPAPGGSAPLTNTIGILRVACCNVAIASLPLAMMTSGESVTSSDEYLRPSPASPFFFQAEDGIRDWSVTGVQTCALPI